MIRAFAEGDIHPARSKELRQWTHLLFTSVAAKAPKAETSVNLIAQLISMEAPTLAPTERQVIDLPEDAATPEPLLLPQRVEEDLKQVEAEAAVDVEVLEIE